MPEKKRIGAFSISQAFTHAFAELSGDSNPLHVDPIAARRYQFGTTVVHGICAALKALDVFFGAQPASGNTLALASIKIQFNKPLHHDDDVEVFHSINEKSHRLELSKNGKRAQIISFELQSIHDSGKATVKSLSENSSPISINNYTFVEAATAEGKIPFNWNQRLAEELFPNATNVLPASQIATLLATTVIVGMKCPGLNSVYGGLNLSFNATLIAQPGPLSYRVSDSDERFNRLLIDTENDIASGQIETFYRAPPVVQPSFKQIKPLLTGNEFAAQRALIIGGSRGLGEITAKILAAGGAKTIITYASGQQDAERVANDINAGSGYCQTAQYNILKPDVHIAHSFTEEPISHIYYLASPVISKSDHLLWDDSLFNHYYRYYVTGLKDLLSPFVESADYKKSALNIFIPSTVFLSEPIKGFGEYCAAKAAAETFAQQIPLAAPRWSAFRPRLPRLQTDQTSGAMSADPMEATTVLLNTLLSLSL
ncbi:MAG: SDR family NAD(P)-dependent oxidoreductase [Porticoccaceae bacterium]|nr:SDR family NAD(P)-dependent oxidoreductase [Pseudomonadales bacterium]MCP5172659.1 SDR family NAD(P)-dependent oxidoreductase [Pseudomonadales bacterium]MCP5302133.1 SDR family NAD(P)-dependent oxidoreductase [Pseudomonadales bacterium]